MVFLLAKKASTLATDSEGRNALHLATRPEIIKVLAQESRLLYATDNNGMTALSLTAHSREAIRILLPRYNQVREAELSEAFWTAICCACPDDAEFLLDSLSKERNCKFLVDSETWDNFVATATLGCFYRAPYLNCAPQINSMIDMFSR